MHKAGRTLALVTLVVLAASIYSGYRIIWGHPFTINQLADRQAVIYLLRDPELATSIGAIDGTILDRHSGKLAEVGIEKRDADYAFFRRAIDEVKQFDRAKLGPQDQITYDFLLDFYGAQAALERFDWLSSGGTSGIYPLNVTSGEAFGLLGFMESRHVVSNEKTARSYVERLRAMGPKLKALTAEMRRQSVAGVVMPRALIDTSIRTIDAAVGSAPRDHSLVTRFEDRLSRAGINPESLRIALRDEAIDAVTSGVYPAFQRMREALVEQRPRALQRSDGVDELPDGVAFYEAVVRQFTTTDYTPEQVHALGVSEVTRIASEMDVLLRSQGLDAGTVGDRIRLLASNSQFAYPDTKAGREQVLTRYRQILDDVSERMPEYFSAVPASKIAVERMPESLEAGIAGAYYEQPAMDGSRPGTFRVNLRDVAETATFKMKTLAYHEGIPGHHFQVAMAMELEGLPIVRQQSVYVAYTEGWALYAERLAYEAGLYETDPLGDLGRLQAEMLRAVRLVVDTGIHSQGWTRKRAIDYLIDQTGTSRSEATSEIERYMAMPGQALAYKLGQMKIIELRERARSALGSGFDLKAFHDVVLDTGAVPLSVLEKVVDDWIAARGMNTAI